MGYLSSVSKSVHRKLEEDCCLAPWGHICGAYPLDSHPKLRQEAFTEIGLSVASVVRFITFFMLPESEMSDEVVP